MHQIFITLYENNERRNRFPGRNGFEREKPPLPETRFLLVYTMIPRSTLTYKLKLHIRKCKPNDCRVRVYANALS